VDPLLLKLWKSSRLSVSSTPSEGRECFGHLKSSTNSPLVPSPLLTSLQNVRTLRGALFHQWFALPSDQKLELGFELTSAQSS